MQIHFKKSRKIFSHRDGPRPFAVSKGRDNALEGGKKKLLLYSSVRTLRAMNNR